MLVNTDCGDNCKVNQNNKIDSCNRQANGQLATEPTTTLVAVTTTVSAAVTHNDQKLESVTADARAAVAAVAAATDN